MANLNEKFLVELLNTIANEPGKENLAIIMRLLGLSLQLKIIKAQAVFKEYQDNFV